MRHLSLKSTDFGVDPEYIYGEAICIWKNTLCVASVGFPEHFIPFLDSFDKIGKANLKNQPIPQPLVLTPFKAI